MRYYELSIVQPGQTAPQYFISAKLPNGDYDSGALQIELDMPIAPFNTPVGAQTIRVHGVSLISQSQAKQFEGGILTLKGGMQKGLPLANPNQAGVLSVGYVFQAMGNWQGSDMSLDFVILPSPFSIDSPGNIVFSCNYGTDIRLSIIDTLRTAFTGYTINVNLPDPIVSTQYLVAYHHTLEGFASDILSLSQLFTSKLKSVYITIQKGCIEVYQVVNKAPATPIATGTTLSTTPIQLNFFDFVGQPTWIRPNVIQLFCVMRADVMVGAIIKMPPNIENLPGFVQTAVSSLPSSLKYNSVFKGDFIVISLRHIGSFRNSDPLAWATVIEAGVYGE